VSGWDDLPDEMRGERIDAGTMDRLLRGRMTPDDAPPGYSDVASVLLAVASRPTQEELALEMQHVTAARTVIGRGTVGRRIRPLRLVAGLVVVGALVAIPGLAAGNVLPDPAQHAVSQVLDKVGISVPANETHPANTAVHPASTGAEVSNLARTTNLTGVAKGAAISTLASGGKSQAGQHGKAATAGANDQGPAHSASAAAHGATRSANAASSSNAGGAPTHP